MTKIEINPLQGIVIENVGHINLGQHKSEVEKILGIMPSDEQQLFCDDYEFRIDYNEFGYVEFIEFVNGPFPELTELSIYGVNPFQLTAEELVEILSEKNNGDIDDSEAESGYSFMDISVGIWRESTVQDVEEMIKESKENGTYDADKNWLNEDLEKSRHFWTIGIGVKGYYA